MRFRTEVIQSTPLEQGHVLCAIRASGSDTAVTVYCDTRTPRKAFVFAPETDVEQFRRIGGGLQIRWTPSAPADETLDLPLADRRLAVPLLRAQTGIFAGLRCALVVNAGQTGPQMVQWLQFHARHHGLEGAVIVSRAKPDAPEDLGPALQGLDIPGLKEVVLVRFDLPLGQPSHGPEWDPVYAPDASGKDRMTPPAPDAWRAPLGEGVIFEVLRDLYLRAARAVLCIDTSDLVRPIENSTVFEQAADAPDGTVRLLGDRAYPWGLRKNTPAEYGDHICLRFDGHPSHARWCTDLQAAPPDTVWRRVRASGTRTDDAPALRYVRCMALRHAGAPLARIVPKSSLVENDTLVALMKANFGGKPRRAPTEKLKVAAHSHTDRSGIVTCMKNEGPFVLEWLAYHRAIGVEDFLIYSNDCTDGTDHMLDVLQAKGCVQHRNNPYRETGMKPQHAALHAANAEPVVKALDWVIVTDVDEFINIHVGDGHLDDLYGAVGDANMISMTWRLFGNADIAAYEDRLILEQFLCCAPQYARKPHQAWGFKTAMRNSGIFKKLGVHRPKGLRPQLMPELRWVNGSGVPMPQQDYRNAWRSTKDTYGYDLVTLNHYALRSAESFLVKRDRGRVNHVDRDQGLTYWFRMNHNTQEDRSILRRLDATRDELSKLMADPDIAAAHAASVAAHRSKIGTLLQSEKYRAFYQEITGSRLRKLSRMLEHFGSAVFFHGPDVIPEDVFEAAKDPQYFFTIDGAAEAD